MKPMAHTKLKLIIIGYILFFLLAFVTAVYYLFISVTQTQIALIELLKYALLCVLFIILLRNTISALSLSEFSLYRMANSVKNFKYLFSLVIVLMLLAKTGMFNSDAKASSYDNDWLFLFFMIMAIFCYWSNNLLQRYEALEKPADEA